jgi:hypothetical protein
MSADLPTPKKKTSKLMRHEGWQSASNTSSGGAMIQQSKRRLKCNLKYGEVVYMQSQSEASKWWQGYGSKGSRKARAYNKLTDTSQPADSYRWQVRSLPGDAKTVEEGASADPKHGEDVTYGDTIFLQNQYKFYVDENKQPETFLKHSSGAAAMSLPEVVTEPNGANADADMLLYEWQLRSEPGSGSIPSADPKSGDQVQYGDVVYFQVMNEQKRWLNGGGSSQGSVTDKSGADGNFQVQIRETEGSGALGETENGICHAQCTVTYDYKNCGNTGDASGEREHSFPAAIKPGGDSLLFRLEYDDVGGVNDQECKHSFRDAKMTFKDANGEDQEELLVDNVGNAVEVSNFRFSDVCYFKQAGKDYTEVHQGKTCDAANRISASCGECTGADYGESGCKLLCDDTADCVYIETKENHGGCKMYSGCANVADSAGSTLFQQVPEPIMSCSHASYVDSSRPATMKWGTYCADAHSLGLTVAPMMPDEDNNGKKCGAPGNAHRLFDLRGPEATDTKCDAECQNHPDCITYSYVFEDWCVGCDQVLTSGHAGAVARKKAPGKLDTCAEWNEGDVTGFAPSTESCGQVKSCRHEGVTDGGQPDEAKTYIDTSNPATHRNGYYCADASTKTSQTALDTCLKWTAADVAKYNPKKFTASSEECPKNDGTLDPMIVYKEGGSWKIEDNAKMKYVLGPGPYSYLAKTSCDASNQKCAVNKWDEKIKTTNADGVTSVSEETSTGESLFALDGVPSDAGPHHCNNGAGGQCQTCTYGSPGCANWVTSYNPAFTNTYEGFQRYCESWQANAGVFQGGCGPCGYNGFCGVDVKVDAGKEDTAIYQLIKQGEYCETHFEAETDAGDVLACAELCQEELDCETFSWTEGGDPASGPHGCRLSKCGSNPGNVDCPESKGCAQSSVQKAGDHAMYQLKEPHYKMGDLNTNTCMDGYTKIDVEVECETAMAHVGITHYIGSVNSWKRSWKRPGGCYQDHKGRGRFSPHEGGEHSKMRPLCKKGSCYSEEVCRAKAQKQGFSLGGSGREFVGDFQTSGCFSYSTGGYKGQAFYGRYHSGPIHTDAQLTETVAPEFRVAGTYACQASTVGWHFADPSQSCEDACKAHDLMCDAGSERKMTVVSTWERFNMASESSSGPRTCTSYKNASAGEGAPFIDSDGTCHYVDNSTQIGYLKLRAGQEGQEYGSWDQKFGTMSSCSEVADQETVSSHTDGKTYNRLCWCEQAGQWPMYGTTHQRCENGCRNKVHSMSSCQELAITKGHQWFEYMPGEYNQGRRLKRKGGEGCCNTCETGKIVRSEPWWPWTMYHQAKYHIAELNIKCGDSPDFVQDFAHPEDCKSWCTTNEHCLAFVTNENSDCHMCFAYLANDCSPSYQQPATCSGTVTGYNKALPKIYTAGFKNPGLDGEYRKVTSTELGEMNPPHEPWTNKERPVPDIQRASAVPCGYDKATCIVKAKEAGMSEGGGGHDFASDSYATKGCFTYTQGEKKGLAFYGTKDGQDAGEGDMLDPLPEEHTDADGNTVKLDIHRVEGTSNCNPYTGMVNVPTQVQGTESGPVISPHDTAAATST